MRPFKKNKQEQSKKKILLSALITLGCLALTTAVVVPVCVTQCKPKPPLIQIALLITGYPENKLFIYEPDPNIEYFNKIDPPVVTTVPSGFVARKTHFEITSGRLPGVILNADTGAISGTSEECHGSEYGDVTIQVTDTDYPGLHGEVFFTWTNAGEA